LTVHAVYNTIKNAGDIKMNSPIIEKALSEIKSMIATNYIKCFEEIQDDSGNISEFHIICAKDKVFWNDLNILVDTYKTVSGISEIPLGDGIMPLKEVPYELEGYYIRITLSTQNDRWMQIHLGKREWINQKNKKLIENIIVNARRNLASWENSLDIWKEKVYVRNNANAGDIDPMDSLELV
jgi:hypothetical protein